MVINTSRTQAACSLGWVHKGNLWVYEIGHASPRLLALSNAKYLSIKAGKKDFFSIVHHWDGDKLEISAHNHEEPHRRLSSISLRRSDKLDIKVESSVTGDASIWKELPQAYVAYAFGDFHLFLVQFDGSVTIQTFPWYSSTAYDKDYQGIVGVEELPNSHLLIVSVQRDSNPIVYDPESRVIVRKLNLADRNGNPRFKLRSSMEEFWAIDYDTVVKLDAKTLNATASRRLQDSGGTSQRFVGELSFCRAETLCLVARPFSGDVVGLDCDSMRETHRSTLGKQPLQAGLLGDDKVVALDWKTGEFLIGELEEV